MTKAQIRAAIIRIQSEQLALYPDIPAEYYSIYRQHKPREPAQTGYNQALTATAKRDIFYVIGGKISRVYKAIRRKKKMKIYEITDIQAIAECAGDTEPQNAVLVHEIKDKFKNGDCILFGYSATDFENDSDVLTALQNETPENDFTIDKHGIYHA